jgi:asparagine synthase (glutamine-hydrolysing)
MCRISGFYYLVSNHSTAQRSAIIGKMTQSLSHGGPDDEGIYLDQHVALGHRRLSIIDLSALGHQPYEWDKYVMVYNGEMYNYEEVRIELIGKGYEFISHSDTEVIIKAYHEWGNACIHKFRGMFAFAIWNKLDQKMLLCRDRIGVKPLYWYWKDGLFMFGSELKAFHHHPDFCKDIDYDAVNLYMQSGYIRSPFSIFKYVKKLEPGSYLSLDEKSQPQIQKYWSIDQKAKSTRLCADPDDVVIKNTEDLLTEAFNLRMVADVPVGVFLSGGIDSSLVTALLQKDRDQPINTYTIGFEDKVYDESHHAADVAKALGTHHHSFICNISEFERITESLSDIYDEPFGDSSGIPTTLVSEEARKHVTVALSADAGDELFSGYERYLIANKYYDKIRKVPYALREMAAGMAGLVSPAMAASALPKVPGFGDVKHLEIRYPKMVRALKSKSRLDFLSLVTSSITSEALQELMDSVPVPIFEMPTELPQDQYLSMFTVADATSYLEGDIMTKVDRATMSVALEAREPFLDHKVIEYALSLPNKFKIRDHQSKWVLRQILYQYVPSSAIDRRKQGFGIPFIQWLSTLYINEVRDMAGDNVFLEHFKLNADFVKKETGLFLEGKTGMLEHGTLWYLFVLYRWYKRWIRA